MLSVPAFDPSLPGHTQASLDGPASCLGDDEEPTDRRPSSGLATSGPFPGAQTDRLRPSNPPKAGLDSTQRNVKKRTGQKGERDVWWFWLDLRPVLVTVCLPETPTKHTNPRVCGGCELLDRNVSTCRVERLKKAERAGFEPAVPEGTLVFETSSISHSDTSPAPHRPFAPPIWHAADNRKYVCHCNLSRSGIKQKIYPALPELGDLLACWPR